MASAKSMVFAPTMKDTVAADMVRPRVTWSPGLAGLNAERPNLTAT